MNIWQDSKYASFPQCNIWPFFGINDKFWQVQQKKFYKLVYENKTENYPENVIFKFSKYELADAKKNLLGKGLDFFLARKQLNYAI